jgi:hypothetical protein
VGQSSGSAVHLIHSFDPAPNSLIATIQFLEKTDDGQTKEVEIQPRQIAPKGDKF